RRVRAGHRRSSGYVAEQYLPAPRNPARQRRTADAQGRQPRVLQRLRRTHPAVDRAHARSLLRRRAGRALIPTTPTGATSSVEFLQQNWYWAALAAVSGAWLMADLIRNRGDKSQLSPVEATMLVNREDAIIIDVREQGEYAQGHIPNARHIPAREPDPSSKEMEQWMVHPATLCSAPAARPTSAGNASTKARFANVYTLRRGMSDRQ